VTYPPEAYAPSGALWWRVGIWPGTKKRRFGVEPRLASWLHFNTKPGEIFTLRRLRKALGDIQGANTDEQFGRRFRRLRDFGWVVLSGRDAHELGQDEYRIEQVGDPIWRGKSKRGQKVVSAKTRRRIFDRDGNRCLLCGVASGEPYPDRPGQRARLTIGHFVAGALAGPAEDANLRTECARCNEPVKEEARRGESAVELWPKIRGLKTADKTRLLRWLRNGYRDRDTIDKLFDQIRILPPAQRDEIRAKLERSVG
jgi:5-methylcytosine-specific restriction endonuclease McrA